MSCCKVNSERTLYGQLADAYGYAAIKDIVECERRHAEATLLDQQIQEIRRRWKNVFVREMCCLLRVEQPQDNISVRHQLYLS